MHNMCRECFFLLMKIFAKIESHLQKQKSLKELSHRLNCCYPAEIAAAATICGADNSIVSKVPQKVTKWDNSFKDCCFC